MTVFTPDDEAACDEFTLKVTALREELGESTEIMDETRMQEINLAVLALCEEAITGAIQRHPELEIVAKSRLNAASKVGIDVWVTLTKAEKRELANAEQKLMQM